MTRPEAEAYLIGYFEKTAKEMDARAKRLEGLGPHLTDPGERRLMATEAKFLRKHAKKFRELANVEENSNLRLQRFLSPRQCPRSYADPGQGHARNGWSKFGNILNEARCDLFDLNRPSLV